MMGQVETKLNFAVETFFRSNHRSRSIRKGVLRNFTKFTGKHLYQSLFFNKVAGLRPETLLQKRLWHRCFPVNFAKLLRTPFLQNTSGRLLLIFLFMQHCNKIKTIATSQPAITCSKLTIETLEQGVKYVQS